MDYAHDALRLELLRLSLQMPTLGQTTSKLQLLRLHGRYCMLSGDGRRYCGSSMSLMRQ